MATIVIHSRTREKISGTCCFEWSLHSFHRTIGGELVMTENKLIDRQRALRIIFGRGLVEAFRTNDGVVYDTASGDFKALFPRGIRSRDDMEKIEKTDKL